MKTEIKEYCRELAQALAPFESSLRGSLEKWVVGSDLYDDAGLLQGLRAKREDLAKVLDQLAAEEAYLLIFGPLKSGKSTLMNAVSGSYVSEVTSLPAYPCLVYVRHGQKATHELTRYSGEKTTFPGNAPLQETIRQSHRGLAEAIKRVEDAGGQFDPESDYPEAIRRVDISLTAAGLDSAGTVLVDTPGLYAKMKFGYDRMTRDFRDRAACALFVVKADNLFLEPVFDEFEELLANFSRIFLVVNIDQAKKDLDAQGRLVPSVESTDPQLIVEAFRSLSVNTTIRRAFEEGKLQVYPIDLLHAAQGVLTRNSAEATGQNASFEQLVADLEAYLNGMDYVAEFKRDLGRRVTTVVEGLAGYLGPGAADKIEAAGRVIEQEKALAARRLKAAETVGSIDWGAVLGNTLRGHEEKVRSEGEQILANLREQVDQALTAWMDTDDSVHNLLLEKLNPLCAQGAAELHALISRESKSILAAANEGALFSGEEAQAVQVLELRLGEVLAEALSGAEAALPESPVQAQLEFDDIPVRKTWIEWLLFRRAARIRREVFGPEEQPDTSLLPAVKEQRLGEKARKYFGRRVAGILRQAVLDDPAASGRNALRSMGTRSAELLPGIISAKAEEAARQMEESRQRLRELERIKELVAGLERDYVSFRQQVLGLVEEPAGDVEQEGN